MNNRIRPWSNLPEGIVDLIINKLHFPDQVRALSVCKPWRSCKDYVTTSDSLPWVVSYGPGVEIKDDKYSVTCELFDPYSQEVFSKAYRDLNTPNTCVLASSRGWLLIEDVSSLVLHGPFTHDRISLPFDTFIDDTTMKVSRKPSECEIFTVIVDDVLLAINSCCFSNDDGRIGDLKSHAFYDTSGYKYRSCLRMLYMNGSIYFLLENQHGDIVLNRYRLEDKSWEWLAEGFADDFEAWGLYVSCWLMEMNENLMMVRLDVEDERYKWYIFRFDLSEMSWVVETNLKNCAIFISDVVAFSAALTDRYGKKLEGCKVFYHDRVHSDFPDRSGFTCYSLSEAGDTQIQSHEYEWINRLGHREFYFVEPPYFGA